MRKDCPNTPRINGGCRLFRPLVRIVIPFACNESDCSGPEYENALYESLVAQFGRGEAFDIGIVFVLQEKDGKIHKLLGWEGLETKTLILNADKYDYPTTFHQVGMGFEHCLDAEYCMYMTSNDILAPLFIASAIKRMGELSAKVVYGDTLRMDPDMMPHQCDKPCKEFLPFEWFRNGEGKANQLPDICLIDPSLLELVPFDPKYKRGSFMIWWFKIWEEYGHTAFAYVNTIGCMYRPHKDHLSDRSDWVAGGLAITRSWMDSRPWMKYTGFA